MTCFLFLQVSWDEQRAFFSLKLLWSPSFSQLILHQWTLLSFLFSPALHLLPPPQPTSATAPSCPHVSPGPLQSLYQCKFFSHNSLWFYPAPWAPGLSSPYWPFWAPSHHLCVDCLFCGDQHFTARGPSHCWTRLSCAKLYCASLPRITYVQRGWTGWVQYSVTCSVTSSLPQQSSCSNRSTASRVRQCPSHGL